MHLKVRLADFLTITRSQTLPEPSNITEELRQTADEMLRGRLPSGHLPVRLLGMGVSGLDDSRAVQGLLFGGKERQKQSRIDAISDQIKEQFGPGGVEARHRCSLVRSRRTVLGP